MGLSEKVAGTHSLPDWLPESLGRSDYRLLKLHPGLQVEPLTDRGQLLSKSILGDTILDMLKNSRITNTSGGSC